MDRQPEFRDAPSAAVTDVAVDRDAIIHALEHDGEFFIQFFLGDELEFQVPKFHLDTWEYLINPTANKVAVALPRGHAKTTLSKLAVVWYLLFSDSRFVVYVSNTATIAMEACKDIMNYVRSDNFKAVFGNIVLDIDRQGFYKFTMQRRMPDGTWKDKFVILKSAGAGQQVRGMNIDNTRPELAVVDDLEDDENTATPLLILKLKKWFFGPFIKALSKKRHKIIFLGNMLSAESLLYHFCEKSDQWHSLRFGCLLSTGDPLWPEMWSLDDIRSDFVEYQKLGLIGRWFAEMMNMPVSDQQALIAAEDIYYAEIVLPGQQTAAFITIDPAVSQKTWADETAIVVHACFNDLWRVVDYAHGKYTPDQIFAITLGFGMKWRTRCVGIEAAGYQASLKFIFDVLSVVKNQRLEICEVPHKNKPKLERISAWCSMMRKKQWALSEGEYAVTEQLLSYDPIKKANKDDLIDACSMGVTMVQMYMSTIMDVWEVDHSEYAVTYHAPC